VGAVLWWVYAKLQMIYIGPREMNVSVMKKKLDENGIEEMIFCFLILSF
jgi:hypothetical protein